MLEDSRRLIRNSKLIPPVASLYNSVMTRFRVGDLVRVSSQDILRPGDAGIVRKVLDNPTGDESLQEYIVEFGDRVFDEVSEEGFRLRVHSDARIHCYLSIYLEDANEPAEN
jgi:hypothetical protein